MRKSLLPAALVAIVCGCPVAAHAQSFGYSTLRYTPTPAGEWFFAVEHPWYSSTRWFAGGVTFDYGDDPLVYVNRDQNGRSYPEHSELIENQMLLHVDLAAAFLDRIQVNLSLPVLLQNAAPDDGPNSLSLAHLSLSGAMVGDPRVGAMVRVWGDHDKDAIAISAGLHLWIPIGVADRLIGDSNVRLLPKVIVGGAPTGWIRWSLNVGFLLRFDNDYLTSTTPANIAVNAYHELQASAGIQFTDKKHTLAIGPEIFLGTQTNGFFENGATTLEGFLGAHYLIADTVLVGVAGGMGWLHQPGEPDFRLLARVAYAPVKRARPRTDLDHDGVFDDEDACPDRPGVRTTDPTTNGCPPPPPDRDHDGVPDSADVCADEPQGVHPDPTKPGCPAKDQDQDGIWDYEDQCPTVPKGDHPDPKRHGCPAIDTDGDGVYDNDDQCPTVAAGVQPDPNRPGCPNPDRDNDTVPDAEDACPDKPGAPSTDPKKNGCPGLVEVKNGMIVILQPVFFATDKDKILPKSYPVLNAVVAALDAQPGIKKLAVEGHTDNKGKAAHNLDLSQRRADSIMRYLVEHGISVDRLEAHGYGSERPIQENKTSAGRAANRRVEFHITDPAPPSPSTTPAP